mgnify:CR=1 FL=1
MDREGRADAHFRGHLDVAAKQVRNLPADAQAKAVAVRVKASSGIVAHLAEVSEQKRQVLLRDPDSHVCHTDSNPAVIQGSLDCDSRAFFGKLNGVAQQVLQYLLDAAPVTVHHELVRYA